MIDIEEYAKQAIVYVRNATSVDLDYTHETLPLLDHVLTNASNERESVQELMAETAAAYFGKVLVKAFDGTWDTDGEVANVSIPPGITVTPLAMAWAAITKSDSGPNHAYSLEIASGYKAAAKELLAAMAPQTEEVYYSLGGRFDALFHLCSVLRNEIKEKAESKEPPQAT